MVLEKGMGKGDGECSRRRIKGRRRWIRAPYRDRTDLVTKLKGSPGCGVEPWGAWHWNTSVRSHCNDTSMHEQEER